MLRLEDLHGLGPKRRQALHDAGITDVEGLMDCLPRGYMNVREARPISTLQEGEHCLEGRLVDKPGLQYYSGRSIVRATLEDSSGRIRVFWFNQPWMAKQLIKGEKLILFGRVQVYQGKQALVNPKLIREMGIQPLYRPLPGLPGKVFSGFISQVLESGGLWQLETLPEAFRSRHNLCGRAEAWRMAHFPQSENEVDTAKRRLAFENLLLYQIAVRLERPQGQKGPEMKDGGITPDRFWREMPFRPTAAQVKAMDEILRNMRDGTAMRRLVQGDVGSGKTAVAFGAAAYAISSGYQCALMAPTELLARQHYENAVRMLAPFGIKCGLLTGSLQARERREALELIKDGTWGLIVGTHALISQGVNYRRLGLVITDEQHRFGVRQRQTLSDRAGEEWIPHMLALSATPIPRSLALVLYGDLKVSVIDELPPGRQPVKTRIVPESKREDLYLYLKQKAKLGERSYLVCPLVEDSEVSEAKSAVSLYRQLESGPLKGVSLALTYGNQRQEEKEAALSAFYSGRVQVLVSTTVIEVGMDVPEATTMVVEDAEMFGLAQLHQLRGRVGRGKKESWCFLMGESNERLDTMTKTNDGFFIAQKDLELRGPGEFLGTRQHGRMLDAYGISDIRLIEETGSCLEELGSDAGNGSLYLQLQELAKKKYATRLADAGLH